MSGFTLLHEATLQPDSDEGEGGETSATGVRVRYVVGGAAVQPIARGASAGEELALGGAVVHRCRCSHGRGGPGHRRPCIAPKSFCYVKEIWKMSAKSDVLDILSNDLDPYHCL